MKKMNSYCFTQGKINAYEGIKREPYKNVDKTEVPSFIRTQTQLKDGIKIQLLKAVSNY